MKRIVRRVISIGSALAIASAVGCFGDPRISNQGGGNVLTAVDKFSNDQVDQMTPDEVQILTDLISDLSPDLDITLNDDQAAAVTDFIEANNITSLDDAEQLINQAIEDPDSVVIPEGFLEQFEDLDVDLESLGSLDLGSLDLSNLGL